MIIITIMIIIIMIIIFIVIMIIITSPVQGGSCQLVHLVSVRWSSVQQCVDQTWHIVTLWHLTFKIGHGTITRSDIHSCTRMGN